MTPRTLLTLAALALATLPAAAELDKPMLYKHLQRSFNTPPGVEFELGEVKPSPIEGFMLGALESRFRGNSQKHEILLSNDGRYYVLSSVYALKESGLPGLLVTEQAGGDDGAPVLHVTKDGKHFFMGEPKDLTVDPEKATQERIRVKGVPGRGGPETAPIIVVEYSDLQCPYCKNAHLALDEKLEATYGKKVRWVFKHFPLTSIHPWAYPAAIAMACASKQKPEAAFKMETAIFNQQESVTAANLREKVVEEAKKTGIKVADFEQCFDKQETKDVVDADMAEARSIKVNSTPTIIVNGRTVQGFRDFDSLKAVIDEMLAEKEGKKKAEKKDDKKDDAKDEKKGG
ncbi:MAG: DsbA family protein [Elusimicrobia bacterium]|nr:DsbA family protein [Elusimicrobiota bacterium]